jgi:predicted membrane-bound spermidine synthase
LKQQAIHFFAFAVGFFSLGYELVSGKMTEPFFGAGLESWTCVLVSIMAGFALGYFLGSMLSSKNSPAKWVFRLTAAASALLLLLLLLGDGWMGTLYRQFGASSLLLIQFLLSFPPIFLLSATSPLLIRLKVAEAGDPGRASGTLLALSTLGGVAGIFASGFWLLPTFGLGTWLVMHTFLLAALALLWHLLQRQSGWLPLLTSAVLLVGVCGVVALRQVKLPDDILYRNTGLHGELIVTDMPLEKEYGGWDRRMILNNRIAQTAINPEANISLWDYPHYLSSVAGMQPAGGKALLLGMAGGTVAVELTQLGYAVDAVDLDPRMETIGRSYFNLPPSTNVFIDDARHYLNTTPQRYDLVVMDLFSAEGQPAHVFSQEAFTQVKEVLTPEGLLIINYHGFFDGEEGLGTRSVVRTLRTTGLNTYTVATPGSPVQRNLLLIGTQRPIANPDRMHFRQNPCCNVRLGYIGNMIIGLDDKSCADGLLLRDDLPALDRLNRFAYRQWREYAIEHYLLPLHQKGLPFY